MEGGKGWREGKRQGQGRLQVLGRTLSSPHDKSPSLPQQVDLGPEPTVPYSVT
jgi:hypothetical protein